MKNKIIVNVLMVIVLGFGMFAIKKGLDYGYSKCQDQETYEERVECFL